jgi:hypothetical protein
MTLCQVLESYIDLDIYYLAECEVLKSYIFMWSLVSCVCFVDLCLSFCTVSFGHCVVYSSSIYGFWLALWYLQTLLSSYIHTGNYNKPLWNAAMSLANEIKEKSPSYNNTQYTLRPKLSTTLYFYRYIFLHQYC